MGEITFKNLFFRLYDRKIADGTVTFSRLGISKEDFTRMCTEQDFVFDDSALVRICSSMKLTGEEQKEFLEAAERARNK